MTAIITLRPTDSFDVVWSDLVYTHARLSARKETNALAPPFMKLLERLDTDVRVERYARWRDETIADAIVDAADEDLDECVQGVDVALQHVLLRDTTSPRYTRYFREAPSRVVRLALAAQLVRVDGWARSLASEPEAALKAQAKALAAAEKRGEEALAQRTAAAGERADHFVRTVTTFVQEINDQREATYGQLIELGQKLGKRPATQWARRFFRKSVRTSAPDAQAPTDSSAAPTTQPPKPDGSSV